jgi:hypothetical protein
MLIPSDRITVCDYFRLIRSCYFFTGFAKHFGTAGNCYSLLNLTFDFPVKFLQTTRSGVPVFLSVVDPKLFVSDSNPTFQ